MDVFHTVHRRSLVVVAYKRYLAVLADALSSDRLARLPACIAPLGIQMLVAFATKLHANLAVNRPLFGPHYAFEWVLLEKRNGQRPVISVRRVAHSRLYCFTHFLYCRPYSVPLLLLQFHFRQQTCHSTPNTCRPSSPKSLFLARSKCCSVFNLWLIATPLKPVVHPDRSKPHGIAKEAP